MASITIRDLDDGIKARLRIRAAEQGRSMEEEARNILRSALERRPARGNLAAALRKRFAGVGGVDLVIEPREPMRPAPALRR